MNDADLVPCPFLFLDNYRSAEDSEDEYEDDGGGLGWTGDTDDEENPLARAMLLVVSAHHIQSPYAHSRLDLAGRMHLEFILKALISQ